jgi:hypothetical protein
MIRLWGWVIPKTPTDRSTRAAVKSMQRQCVVMDNSVERALLLTAEKSGFFFFFFFFVFFLFFFFFLVGCLEAGVVLLGDGLCRQPVKYGAKSGQILCVYENEVIAPVRFLWRNGTNSQILLWIHSAGKNLFCLFFVMFSKYLLFFQRKISFIQF